MPYSHGHSPNYDYVIDRALALTAQDGRILDFGCGFGGLLEIADKRGVGEPFFGVDTYEGHYSGWREAEPDAVSGRISAIHDGHIPHDDASFDVVVSNQVFEHIADPQPSLAEIARVLKPGGAFLALFPTVDIWYEGHVGLYFAHWFGANLALQERWLQVGRGLGFGLYHGTRSKDEWAAWGRKTLQEVCFYHTLADVRRWWRDAFGSEPQSMAIDYMRYRIAAHPRFKTLKRTAEWPGVDPLLAWVCHRRAGQVLLVCKAG